MKQEATTRKKFIDKLGQLGKTKRLVLIFVIFVVVFVPLVMIYQQQPARVVALKQELSSLSAVVLASNTKKTGLESAVNKAEAELKLAKNMFARIENSPEIVDRFLSLAKSNNLEIVRTQQSKSPAKMTQNKKTIEYILLTVELDAKGQIPDVLHFLINIDSEIPMSRIKAVKINVAPSENELDTATIVMELFCIKEEAVTNGYLGY